MVIGIEITLAKPLSSEDIIGSYGKGYDMVENHKNGKTIRYWVLEESGQMPISLHAVDFEFNQDDKTCNYYRIATSHFDFVQRKFEELADTWNKYGID
jgi:hypothetical protein